MNPQTMHEQAAIAACGVSVAFGGVKALDNVSIGVPRGSIFSVIGPNGAGKSTLLNIVSGVLPAGEGEIRIHGKRWRHGMQLLATLGVTRTFQNLALFQGLSVLENVLVARHALMRSGLFATGFGLGFARSEEERHRDAALQALRLLEIDQHAQSAVNTLPYGIQKRVELARALALEPTVLLLDEPMAGITPAEKKALAQLVRGVHAQHDMTIVLIEHDMEIVMALSDRIAVLDRGVKIAEGTPAEIASDRAVIAAYLGQPEEAAHE